MAGATTGGSAASSPRSPGSPLPLPPPLRERKLALGLGGAPKNEMSPKEWAILDVFRKCDRSGDGYISRRELQEACRVQPAVALFFGLPEAVAADEKMRKHMVDQLFAKL